MDFRMTKILIRNDDEFDRYISFIKDNNLGRPLKALSSHDEEFYIYLEADGRMMYSSKDYIAPEYTEITFDDLFIPKLYEEVEFNQEEVDKFIKYVQDMV